MERAGAIYWKKDTFLGEENGKIIITPTARKQSGKPRSSVFAKWVSKIYDSKISKDIFPGSTLKNAYSNTP